MDVILVVGVDVSVGFALVVGEWFACRTGLT